LRFCAENGAPSSGEIVPPLQGEKLFGRLTQGGASLALGCPVSGFQPGVGLIAATIFSGNVVAWGCRTNPLFFSPAF
jgi:hypothetical protein